MEIIILELLSVISLIFSGLSLVFSFSGWKLPLLFSYVFGVTLIFSWKKPKKFSIGLFPMFLSLPFFIQMTWENGLITGIYTLTLFYYHNKVLGRRNLDDLMVQFKVVYIAMLGATFFGLLISRFYPIVEVSLPFMLLYFFSTIILSASIRHKEARLDPKKNRQKLIFYLGISAGVSLLIGVSQVREAFAMLLSLISDLIQQIIFFILYPLIYGVSWVITKAMGIISIPLNMEYEEEEVLGGIEEGVTQTASKVRESPIVEVVLIIGVIALTLFLVYRYIKAMRERTALKLPYEEQREFILEDTLVIKRKKRDKLPLDPNGQVRYYYRQYLRGLNQKTLLKKQDTSFSIQEKARDFYGKNEEIRKLYMKYRYTEEVANDKIVEKMKKWSQEKEKF